MANKKTKTQKVSDLICKWSARVTFLPDAKGKQSQMASMKLKMNCSHARALELVKQEAESVWAHYEYELSELR